MRTNVTIRCIMIRNNKIVLCRHQPSRGFYFLPGGGLEYGETIDECIKRELNEEMGLARDRILINSDSHVIEHVATVNPDDISEADKIEYHVVGDKVYSINILKQVYVNADKIESKESPIAFEEFKISDLPALDIKPVMVKDYLLQLIE
ncbi:MAG: NUDIX domain-containing protein [Rickettsiales bacterium]|jgi:8-oxo-dGTP pyrophosphatase MutT (NUDIX family)|nr:NUDIX domain-containing protein [Rickettsiales bacterium]